MTYDDWKTTDTSDDIAGPRHSEEDDEVADLYRQIATLEERLRVANEQVGEWKARCAIAEGKPATAYLEMMGS